MLTLLPTLLDYDPGLLAIIAHRWDVDLEALGKREAAETLAAAMLEPERAAAEWARLTDHERGALQMLLGAVDHKMTEAQFSRLYGEVRPMGPEKRDREKPHLQPANVAEILYYRGLVAIAFDQGKAGMQRFVYVPPDLTAILPVHRTGFDVQADDVVPVEARVMIEGEFEPETVHPATTTYVDDLTTLLAYLQTKPIPAEKDILQQQASEGLAAHGLSEHSPASAALLLSLASEMGLAATEEGVGVFKAVPAARQWLEQTRPRQVRALVEAWQISELYNELWFTPGLQIEDTGWRNDPRLARQTMQNYLATTPSGWWPVDDLLELIKADEPDFQRPAGDFESWYIRDPETGAYLRGFESWDTVDGAMLGFILTGPLHWLGLIDLGDNGELCRLTVYGRAWCGQTDWPDPSEDRPHLILQSDGTILAPRTLSRYERFQLARFTEWGAAASASDPYVYRLSAAGLQRAAEQGIQVDAIRAFLRRTSGEDLPRPVVQMLERWAGLGGAEIWITREVILRTSTPEAMQPILETPEFRRYLGATLGPTAVIVRAGQEQDLAAALLQHGILVDFDH